jgi:hypothetical protein
MSLTKNDKEVLEEIIEKEGDCLEQGMCQKCPFRSMCLPEFVYVDPPTKNQRFTMALDVITHNTLMDAEIDLDDYGDRIKNR